MATIVLTAVVLTTIIVSGQPNQSSNREKQKTNTVAPETIPAGKNQTASTETTSRADDDPPHWYTPIERPEWWLVGLTILTLGIVGFQAWWTRKAAEATQFAAEGTRDGVIEIRKQVALMERQTEATEKAATAARDSIETVINKERARVRINLKELSLMPRQASIYFVEFTVTVSGSTPAFITETRYTADAYPLRFIGEPDNGMGVLLPFHNFPEVIPSNGDPIEESAIFHFTADDADATMQEIKLDRLFVEIRCTVKYKDVFNRERETRVRKVWRFNRLIPPGHPLRPGQWEECGETEDNKET